MLIYRNNEKFILIIMLLLLSFLFLIVSGSKHDKRSASSTQAMTKSQKARIARRRAMSSSVKSFEERDQNCFRLSEKDILIAVDIQKCFIPQGTIPRLNESWKKRQEAKFVQKNSANIMNAIEKLDESLTRLNIFSFFPALKAIPTEQDFKEIYEPVMPFSGSLQLPSATNFIIDNANLAIRAAESVKSHIFYSLDFHPSNHCSFQSSNGSSQSQPKVDCQDEASKTKDNKKWHPHCIRGREDSWIFPGLTISTTSKTRFIKKGIFSHLDSYSALGGYVSNLEPNKDSQFLIADRMSELHDLVLPDPKGSTKPTPTFKTFLENHDKNARIIVMGLATDISVAHTAIEASNIKDKSGNKFKGVYVIENASGEHDKEATKNFYKEWTSKKDSSKPQLVTLRNTRTGIKLCHVSSNKIDELILPIQSVSTVPVTNASSTVTSSVTTTGNGGNITSNSSNSSS